MRKIIADSYSLEIFKPEDTGYWEKEYGRFEALL
jgi:hypothetical protein